MTALYLLDEGVPPRTIVDLRTRHARGERAGPVDDRTIGQIADPVEAGVIERGAIKREPVENATEAVRMLRRTDDLIAPS